MDCLDLARSHHQLRVVSVALIYNPILGGDRMRSYEKMFSEYKLKEIRCDMRVYDRILIVRCFVNLAP